MDIGKLVELNRNSYISRVDEFSQNYDSHSLVIFTPETLDFWIAIDPPPASRGRWVGFNLKKELDGSGHEPNPLMIPAMSGITIANNIKINENEPWTGKWKVDSAFELNGIWAMKQEGKTVKSIKDSDIEFKGKIQGNQLKGKVDDSGNYLPFIIEIPSDGMSFKGSLNYFGGRQYILKGNRIE
jgi:hypothetical protein